MRLRLPLLRLTPPRRRISTTPQFLFASPIPVPTSPPTPQDSGRPKTTPKCPPPKLCGCEANPRDLDIDRESALMGTMARYYQHCLISTGKENWSSKIEFDISGDGQVGGMAAKVKTVAQRKGAGLRDPYAPTLITNSSFTPESQEDGSCYVLPKGLYIPRVPMDSENDEDVAGLIRKYLLPPASDSPPLAAQKSVELQAVPVRETIILICSHTDRDIRCGLTAPVLRRQFEKVLRAKGMLVEPDDAGEELEGKVRVGYTSHLSGHKYAGNVVVYLPAKGVEESGWGVWYGRVAAEHVEGIVDETVMSGRVVGELVRGVVGREFSLDRN